MNYRSPILATLLLLLSMPLAAEQLLYVAVQDPPRIETYSIHAGTGALKLKWSTELPAAPGPMAVSEGQKHVYVAMRPKKGEQGSKPAIASLELSPQGKLTLIGNWTIPAFASYLTVDGGGNYILSAHYREGQVMVHKIVDGVATSERTDLHETDEKAHCIRRFGSSKFYYVPHTGPNKVYQFQFDGERGKLIPNTPPFVLGPDEEHAYHQPRHITFHPRAAFAFTSNERGGGISCWKIDRNKGTLSLHETHSTLPPAFNGVSAAADVQVTPNGRFVYVSNRDNTDRSARTGQDTIAAFNLNPKSGSLKLVGYFATEHVPRSFVIDTEGRYLFAAGQRSDKLAAYRISQNTGALVRIATYASAKVPIWVTCLKFNQ